MFTLRLPQMGKVMDSLEVQVKLEEKTVTALVKSNDNAYEVK